MQCWFLVVIATIYFVNIKSVLLKSVQIFAKK